MLAANERKKRNLVFQMLFLNVFKKVFEILKAHNQDQETKINK